MYFRRKAFEFFFRSNNELKQKYIVFDYYIRAEWSYNKGMRSFSVMTRRFCLQLDGSKMSPDDRVPPIIMYERKDTRWMLKDKHT